MIQHVMASIFPTLATTSFSSAHHRTKRKKPPPRLTTYRCSYIALLVMISVLSIGVEWLNHFRQPAYLNCTQHSSLLRMFPTVVATSDTTSNVCSSVCSCIWKSGKQTATCDHRSLLAVPNGLVHTTQVIDLSGNALNQLPANVFLERGLVNLQRIFLVDCHLVEISPESFVKLSNLIELDLTNNSLSVVPSKALTECASLRRLSLAGNRIREIRSGAFLDLASLNVLDLSANVIHHLETDAFRGLRSLQTLKLNANQLLTIPNADMFVQFLPNRLASLELHDNRWRCDCHLKPLRQWIVTNNVPMSVKPLCFTPARLQGYAWDSVDGNEFSCPPQIHTVNTHFYKHIGNNVTITCPVTGYPPPVIFWQFESRSATKMDRLSSESGNESLPSGRYSVSEDSDTHMVTSILTVHSLLPADTQRITCFARNVGGQVGKNFTLIVSTAEPFSSSRSMDFIVTEMFVIFASIAILLLAMVVFFTIFIARFKKRSSGHVVHTADTVYHLHNHDSVLGDPSSGVGGQKPPNGNVLNVPNGVNNQASSLVMVNTIDMIQSAIDLQKIATANAAATAAATAAAVNFSSDPNSTDLSSQSTTATSMTLNSVNGAVSPNSNTNNSDNGVFYSATGTSGQLLTNGQPDLALYADQPPPTSGQLYFKDYQGTFNAYQQQPGDILSSGMVSSNSYFISGSNDGHGSTVVTTTAPTRVNMYDHQQAGAMYPNPFNSYPLLNTNRLLDAATSGEVIYGTRIAPTHFVHSFNGLTYQPPTASTAYQADYVPAVAGSRPKVKFADEIDGSEQQQQLSRVAYTFGTIRKRPTLANTGSAEDKLKPIGMHHRSVSSYPEGFESLLVESSVDSGKPIPEDQQPAKASARATKDSLDETEEDDYYQNLQQN